MHYVKDREYELIKERSGKVLYLSDQPGGVATCEYIPAKGQRVQESTIDLVHCDELFDVLIGRNS